MKYRRSDAKEYARAHMKGIWAAALMPFAEDLSIDETGFRRNLRHWVDDLGIDGVFIAGKQSEFFSMSIAERKRSFEIVVDEIGEHGRRHRVLLRPEHGHGDRARQARAGDRRALHRGARAGAAFPAQAGRDALPVLQDDQRAGRHRHRDVEPSGLAAI